MENASLEGDGIIICNKNYQALMKIIGAQKAKGISYKANYIPEVYAIIGDKKYSIDMIVNNQGKRNNQIPLISSACMRLAKFDGLEIENVNPLELEELKALAEKYNQMYQADLYVDGNFVGKTTIGLMKFSVDQIQDLRPKISPLSLGYTQSIQFMKAQDIINGSGVRFADYENLPISEINQSIGLSCVKTLEQMKYLYIPNHINDKDIHEKLAAGDHYKTGYKWLQDYLLENNVFGSDISLLSQAFNKRKQFENATSSSVAEFIHEKCMNGFKIKFPWENKERGITIFNPVFLTEDDRVTINYILDTLFKFLKKLAGFLYVEQNITIHQVLTAYESFLWSLRISSALSLVKQRGNAISGRCIVGSKDIKHTIIPYKTFLEFFGYHYLGGMYILYKESDISMRRSQAGGLTEKIDALVKKFNKSEVSNIIKEINAIIEENNFKAGILRHPVLGFLPKEQYRVGDVNNIIVTRRIADRYEGANADADGDIIYVFPII